MIHESYPWKEDLFQRKELFLEYNTVEHFQTDEESTYTILEKAIFYSAFIIRKLLDCKTKLSDKATRYALHVGKFVPVKEVNLLHHWPHEKSHDWNHPKKWTIQGRSVCNFLMHSCIFEFLFNEEKTVTGFLVASDKDRNQALYHVLIKEWLDYMEFIARDEVVGLTFRYDKDTHDYVCTKKTRGPMKWIDDKQMEKMFKQ